MVTVPFDNVPRDWTIGVDVDVVDTAARFPLGVIVRGERGAEWVYAGVGANTVTGKGYVCFFDSDYDAVDELTTTLAKIGQPVGVAMAAMAANTFGWFQINGAAEMRCSASCAADAKPNTTATAGQVDDDATAGAHTIEGAALEAAVGGAAANGVAFLSRPYVGAAL